MGSKYHGVTMDFLAAVSGFASCLLAIIYFICLSREKGRVSLAVKEGGWQLIVVGLGVTSIALAVFIFSFVVVPFMLD